MTYQEIKSFINTYIVQNGVNAITGAQLNTILNELADYKGFDSVVVTTLPAGSDATATVQGMTLVLGIPKGADGRDGQDGQNAVNPFKGWFTTDNIPTTGQAGDYCNVSTTTQPATVTIYRWNTTTNQFEDTGEVPDTATGETFASGETLQQVAIDGTHLVNPVNTADAMQPVLADAKDVMQLKAKMEGVTAEETKITLVENTNWYDNLYVRVTSTDKRFAVSSGNTPNGVLVVNVEGVKRVRFNGLMQQNGIPVIGYGFSATQPNTTDTTNNQFEIEAKAFDGDTNSGTAVYIEHQYEIPVPAGAKWFACTIAKNTTVYGDVLTVDSFYCYLQCGDSVVDLLENQGRSLNDKINEVPFNLDKEGFVDIDLNIYPNITTATIRYTTNLWDNTKYIYNAFKLIPVSPGRIFEVKAHATLSSQITFLKSDTVEIGTTPDYAGNINIVSAISADTTRRFIVPEDAVYMYVLIQQWDNVNIYRTPQYVRLIQPAYIQQSKIVNNFDSTDNNTVLSGALGPVLKPSVEAGKPINRISPLGGQKVQGANLYYADGAWTLGTGRSCTFVDIQGLGIKKIQVVAGDHTTHFGFVSDFTVPENGVEGLENTYASLIGNIITLNSNTSVDRDVPSEAKFIYFNISGEQQSSGNRQTYIPKEVNILEQESNIEPIIPSWNDNYDYETYVEENYYDEYKNQTYSKQKFYKIDHNAEYKLLLFGIKTYGISVYGITTYDSSYNVKRTLYPWGGGSQSGIEQNVNMDDIVFQEDETYVMLMYYHYLAEGAYGPNALGALMRKLKNDNWVPTNNLIYCVSKIKSPVMPYNYQEADTVFSQTDEWSAWDFVMPYNYNRVLFTNKKFPICTFFHGSSGWDSPDNMGYASSERITSATHGKTIIGMLREAGYVVFDINGYGISRAADDKSRHWGNPRAVATVKKAYEVLVDRFNCRRGMAISGISMAGAIAKSYCMTYPGDVVCAAMEAPSELGGTCRFSVTGTHIESQSQTSAAHAWGYTNAAAMYADNDHAAFIGYSPCIAPNVIDENGFIKKIVQTEWNEQDYIFDNLNNFSCYFPVEIKIWHGDADTHVPLEYSQWFVNTVRNANGNATLRLCPNCTHDLNNYPWVRQEIVNYIDSKMKN